MSGTNRANAGNIKVSSDSTTLVGPDGKAVAPLDFVRGEIERLEDEVGGEIRVLDEKVGDHGEQALEMRRHLDNQAADIARIREHIERLDAQYSKTGQERLYRQVANNRAADPRAIKLARTMVDLYSKEKTGKPCLGDGEGSDGYQWAMTEGHKRAQTEGSLSEGGALVDDEQANYITELEESYGLYSRFLARVPMTKNEMKMPTLTGRPTVYFPDEGFGPEQTLITDQVTLSQAAFAQPKLTATRFMMVNDFTLEVLEDSVPMIAGYFADLAAVAFAKAGDEQAFTSQAGVTGPFDGLLFKTGVQEFQMAAGKDAYADMDYDDFLSLMNAVDPFALSGSRFIFSTSLAHHFRAIKDTTDMPLWASMSQGNPNQLFGYPLERLEVMPRLSDGTQNNKAFGLFGNFRFHAWGDRTGLRIDFSNAPGFKSGRDSVRFIKRQAFQLLIGSAIGRIKTANA
jgi:HK97 family phage major capsid protein